MLLSMTSQSDRVLRTTSAVLTREPVLQDKRQEHVKFCKYGVALIERVSGKQQNSNIDVSLERLRKVRAASLAVTCALLH